ncbi:MAG: exodeoxyribonuclease VII small subunit [Eubacteriales bacterium]|nr:exodeoxyribonuclease VII small subunit [Eubacteriales bacterium]
MAKADKNFEKSMEELEKVVAELEKGDLSLDEMLSRFEKGVALSKECSAFLEEAEKRVNILVKGENGEIITEPFDVN